MILVDIMKLLQHYEVEEDIFIGILPASPDNIVSLFISGGYTPVLKEIQEPTFQVRVRHMDYPEGYKLIEKIKNILINTYNYATEEVVYHGFYQIGDIAEIGKDENGRTGFTANFRTYVTTSKDGVPIIPPGGDCEEQIRELLSQIDILKSEKAQLQEQLASLEQEIQNLTGQIELKEAEINDLNLQIQVLQNDIQEKNNLLNQLQDLIDTLKAEKAQLQQELDIINAENANLISQIAEKDTEISSLNSQIKLLQDDIQEKDDIITRLESDINLKQQQISQLQTEIDTLETEKTQLQQQINDLNTENANLIDQITIKDIEISNLNAQIDNLNATIQTLQQRIDELEQGSGHSSKRRIFIDFGSEEYATKAPNWNNMTDPKNGVIENCIDENMEETGIKVSVSNAFDDVYINNYDEDFSDFFFRDVVRDAFVKEEAGQSSIKIENLDKDKYYRITFFSSIDTSNVPTRECSITTSPSFLNSDTISYNPKLNKGITQSRTIRSETGVIYLHFRNLTRGIYSCINSLEIEEMEPFIDE